jgi:hypothetical protein
MRKERNYIMAILGSDFCDAGDERLGTIAGITEKRAV